MRYFLLPLLLLCFLRPLPSVETQDAGNRIQDTPFPAHIDTAITYFGPKEQQEENHGPDIKKFLASVGLDEGYPYCAAFVSYSLENAVGPYGNTSVQSPKVRSALAQDFITNQSIDAKKVLRGQRTVPSGYIHVMPKGETRYGHNGFVLLDWSGSTGITIDANTGLGLPGESERDGQGVWIRQRKIYTTCYFCVKYFTPVRYEN